MKFLSLFICFKNTKKLIDNEFKIVDGIQYSNMINKYENEIKELELILDQTKKIISDYEIQLKELDAQLEKRPIKIVKESIQFCKRHSKCKHISCDFNPMLTTIKEVRDDLSKIEKLYNSLLNDYNNQTRLYTEKIQKQNCSLNEYKNKLEENSRVIVNLNEIVNRYDKYIQQISFENQMIRNYNEKLSAEYEFLNSVKNKTIQIKLESIPEDKPILLSYNYNK